MLVHGKKTNGVDVFDKMGKLELLERDFCNLITRMDLPVYPFCVEEVKRESPVSYAERLCPFAMVVFMLDGGLDFSSGRKEYKLRSGNMLFIPYGENYMFKSNSKYAFYHKLVIEFKGSQLTSLCSALNLNETKMFGIDKNILSLFYDIKTLIKSEQENDFPVLLGKAYEFFYRLAEKAEPIDEQTRLLIQAQCKLENNLKLSIPELAGKLGFNTRDFNSIFKNKYGVSPRYYRINKRIEKAAYYLTNSSLSIKEIAFALGYCNQFYFSSEFRRIMRVSPIKYRKSTS